MTNAEVFLIVWAVVATLLAVYYQQKHKQVEMKYDNTGNLLCDVVVGDVKPRKNNEGFWVVENSHTRIVFKRREMEL
jgi:hypothetical protein